MKNLIPFVIGGVMIAYGIHQVLNPSKWKDYVPSTIERVSPLSNESLITIHGIMNIGLAILYVGFHKYPLIRRLMALWWGNVTALCGNHRVAEGIKDIPFFLLTLYNAGRK